LAGTHKNGEDIPFSLGSVKTSNRRYSETEGTFAIGQAAGLQKSH